MLWWFSVKYRTDHFQLRQFNALVSGLAQGLSPGAGDGVQWRSLGRGVVRLLQRSLSALRSLRLSFSRKQLRRLLRRLPQAQKTVLLDPGNGLGAKSVLLCKRAKALPALGHEPSLVDVQVLTRFCAIEQPYWAAFLRHYQLCGVRHVHVCVQTEQDARIVEESALPAGLNFQVHRLDAALNPSAALQTFPLNLISSDAPFTLMVDCDEYVQFQNPGFTPTRLAEMFPYAGQFYLPWVMAPRLDDSSVGGFWGHVGKPLVRSDRMAAIASDHAFRLQDAEKADEGSLPVGAYGAVVHHYWARSFRDCLLKTFFNRFDDAKSLDKDHALDLIRAGELPIRLRLLAYLDLQKRYLQVSSPGFPMVDLALEERLLRQSLSEADELQCRHNFAAYQQKLQQQWESLPPYPAVSIQALASLLPPLKQRVT